MMMFKGTTTSQNLQVTPRTSMCNFSKDFQDLFAAPTNKLRRGNYQNYQYLRLPKSKVLE